MIFLENDNDTNDNDYKMMVLIVFYYCLKI